MKKCSFCKHNNKDTATFCGQCGTDLDMKSSPPKAAISSPSPSTPAQSQSPSPATSAPTPKIELTAKPPVINLGQPVNLHWSISGATPKSVVLLVSGGKETKNLGISVGSKPHTPTTRGDVAYQIELTTTDGGVYHSPVAVVSVKQSSQGTPASSTPPPIPNTPPPELCNCCGKQKGSLATCSCGCANARWVPVADYASGHASHQSTYHPPKRPAPPPELCNCCGKQKGSLATCSCGCANARWVPVADYASGHASHQSTYHPPKRPAPPPELCNCCGKQKGSLATCSCGCANARWVPVADYASGHASHQSTYHPPKRPAPPPELCNCCGKQKGSLATCSCGCANARWVPVADYASGHASHQSTYHPPKRSGTTT